MGDEKLGNLLGSNEERRNTRTNPTGLSGKKVRKVHRIVDGVRRDPGGTTVSRILGVPRSLFYKQK